MLMIEYHPFIWLLFIERLSLSGACCCCCCVWLSSGLLCALLPVMLHASLSQIMTVFVSFLLWRHLCQSVVWCWRHSRYCTGVGVVFVVVDLLIFVKQCVL